MHDRTATIIVLPYLIDVASLSTTRKLRSFTAFPYGPLSIVTYVTNMTHDDEVITVFDTNVQNDPEENLRDHLACTKPDIVGFSLMFDNSYPHLTKYIKIVKEMLPSTIITIGGQAVNASYHDLLDIHPEIDAVCYREGEVPMYKLLTSIDMIEELETNISWITRESLSKSIDPEATMVDVDDVVNIRYDAVEIEEYSMEESFSPFANAKEDRRQFFLVSSRGCPFKCSFCMNSTSERYGMRYASIDKIMDHLNYLVDEYGMNGLTIYDDQLLYNKPRAKELFSRLASLNIRVECPNGVSVAYIDKELATLMKSAGMDSIYLAIESGAPYVLKNLMNKPLKVEQCFRAMEFLREEDFWIQGFFVNGIPGETTVHREETMDVIRKLGLDWASFSLASPIRGTKLYNECIEKGYISPVRLGEYDMSIYGINVPGISPEKVTMETYLMNLDANFVNNYRMGIGQPELAARAFKYVLDRHPNHAFAHYFYAKAIEQVNPLRSAIDKHVGIVRKICSEFPEWNDYFKHFGIEV